MGKHSKTHTQHQWKRTRTKTEDDKQNPGHVIIYEFWKCKSTDCPDPNRMTIRRR